MKGPTPRRPLSLNLGLCGPTVSDFSHKPCLSGNSAKPPPILGIFKLEQSWNGLEDYSIPKLCSISETGGLSWTRQTEMKHLARRRPLSGEGNGKVCPALQTLPFSGSAMTVFLLIVGLARTTEIHSY